jgi:hypothetical protein
VISRVGYLRLAASLPLLVPLLMWGAWWLTDLMGVQEPSWVGFVTIISIDAMIFAGIPYAVLAIVLLVLLRRHSWRVHLTAAVAAPWILSVLLAPYYRLLGVDHPWGITWRILPWCLGVGYGYLVVAVAGFYALVLARKVSAEGAV